MCLRTLHDRVRNLGLGALYERHWPSGFRGLLDNASPDWASTALPEKVIDLKGFASAGVSAEEIIGHYRESLAQAGGPDVVDRLASTMAEYRRAGYWPPLPDDIEAAVVGRAATAE